MAIVKRPKSGEEVPKEIVTLPGETSPNYALVYACSTLFSLKNAPITSDMQAVLLNDRNPLWV